MPNSASLAFALVACCVAACGRPAPVSRAAAVTVFNHETVFPLSTGEHHKNVDCNACHGQFETFTKFDCLGCHTQSTTDGMHADDKVSGYTYASESCYRCHPNGDCHPKEDCTNHPEDCEHGDGSMAGRMVEGMTSSGRVPAPGAESGPTTP